MWIPEKGPWNCARMHARRWASARRSIIRQALWIWIAPWTGISKCFCFSLFGHTKSKSRSFLQRCEKQNVCAIVSLRAYQLSFLNNGKTLWKTAVYSRTSRFDGFAQHVKSDQCTRQRETEWPFKFERYEMIVKIRWYIYMKMIRKNIFLELPTNLACWSGTLVSHTHQLRRRPRTFLELWTFPTKSANVSTRLSNCGALD